MQIFLIRHPRPLIGTGICYGQLDVDCEDPLPIAAQLKLLLPENTPVISSPLRRARKLAKALDPEARFDARLSEINFGAWEGLAWNDIDRAALDLWAADILNYTPPGGESVSRLQERAIDFASTLDSPRVALVAHAGILRALTGYWKKLPAEDWTQLKFDFGSMTKISL